MKRVLIASGMLIVANLSGVTFASSHGAMSANCAAKHEGHAAMQDCPHKAGKGHGMHGGKKHGKHKHHAMRHANPMPNLMKIVKKQGGQLNLSDEQAKQLAAWRENNMARMHERADKVVALESELAEAALAGAPKAELMGIASRIMTERTQIIATKADCRDNLKRVLNAEQFDKLLSLQAK